MKYTMYEDRDYILIQRPDGSVVFTLSPDDTKHALLILQALNTDPVKVAGAILKPMHEAMGEILDAA